MLLFTSIMFQTIITPKYEDNEENMVECNIFGEEISTQQASMGNPVISIFKNPQNGAV